MPAVSSVIDCPPPAGCSTVTAGQTVPRSQGTGVTRNATLPFLLCQQPTSTGSLRLHLFPRVDERLLANQSRVRELLGAQAVVQHDIALLPPALRQTILFAEAGDRRLLFGGVGGGEEDIHGNCIALRDGDFLVDEDSRVTNYLGGGSR